MPASTPTEIQIDEDVIAAIVDRLNKKADDLDDLAKEGCAHYDRMRDELCGDDGQVPPVYADIADALHATCQKFHRVSAALTERLRHDAAALHRTVSQHGDIQREAAETFDSAETTATVV